MSLGRRADGYEKDQTHGELESFIARAADSPQLQPFIASENIEFGEVTRIEGTPTRGAIVCVPARVTSPENLRMMAIRLEQQRRPPLQGAFLVTEVIDSAMVQSNRPVGGGWEKDRVEDKYGDAV